MFTQERREWTALTVVEGAIANAAQLDPGYLALERHLHLQPLPTGRKSFAALRCGLILILDLC